MDVMPAILDARVMHKRLIPRVNQFNYKSFYVAIPLENLQTVCIPQNVFSYASFNFKDHGNRSHENPILWVRRVLMEYGLDQVDGEILLITMPRSFGYIFNPVSFYLCFDKKNDLRAYICEVNNTFGETHSYVCAHKDGRPIEKNDIIKGKKFFHVSPFIERKGHYEFRISYSQDAFGVWINYYDENGKKLLLTSLAGNLKRMTKKGLIMMSLMRPMISMKTKVLIHWQALKLFLKKVRYVPKPDKNKTDTSGTD